jgi:hypothetical protein
MSPLCRPRPRTENRGPFLPRASLVRAGAVEEAGDTTRWPLPPGSVPGYPSTQASDDANPGELVLRHRGMTLGVSGEIPTREDEAPKYILHSQKDKRDRKHVNTFLGRVDRDALQADRMSGLERHGGEERARRAELLDAILARRGFIADVDAVVGRVDPEGVRFDFFRRDLELPGTGAGSFPEVPQFPIAFGASRQPGRQARERRLPPRPRRAHNPHPSRVQPRHRGRPRDARARQPPTQRATRRGDRSAAPVDIAETTHIDEAAELRRGLAVGRRLR